MPDDELTMTERAALLTLLAEAREVPNAYLSNVRKLDLKKPSREKLARLGLISVRQEKRLYHLELTDLGWRWGKEELGAEAPPRAGAMGAAMYAWLANLPRHLGRADLSLPEVFGRFPEDEPGEAPQDEGAVSGTPSDLDARIRKAYAELVARPGAWVRLADLRPLLGAIDPVAVDRALVRLNRGPDVQIVPESNQKALTQRDRDAAVSIGNQDKHLIAIGA